MNSAQASAPLPPPEDRMTVIRRENRERAKKRKGIRDKRLKRVARRERAEKRQTSTQRD